MQKAVDFLEGTKIRSTFVSTNSIGQRIATPTLWEYILVQGVHIDFAHRTFKWTSETEESAAVHVVIISLSQVENLPKIIFDGAEKTEVENINAYLLDALNVIIKPRSKAFGNVLPIYVGSCLTDGGNLIIKADEYEELILFAENLSFENFMREFYFSKVIDLTRQTGITGTFLDFLKNIREKKCL